MASCFKLEIEARLLQFNQTQADGMNVGPMRRFQGVCFAHLRETLVSYWEEYDDEQLQTIVNEGIERGIALGLVTQLQLLVFVELFSFLGPEFGNSKLDRPAVSMLHNPTFTDEWPKYRIAIIKAAPHRENQ